MSVCEENKVIGKRFKQECRSKGLTADKVGDLIGVSKHTVYSYYRGERLPSRNTIKLIEEKLGISKEIFFN